ncbi:MAG: hypothetical protein GY737_18145 [Desulfobacteraceae bacterium]|nr:hypothetical protein [Desulfobacteraceae bacterium]
MLSSTAACERFFRLYYKHYVEPDMDTLFNLLNSIHSLNDRLEKTIEVNFYEIEEFIALKALRNLFHHQDELINELRIISVEEVRFITTDLLFLCLVPGNLVEKSFEFIPKKRRSKEEKMIKSAFIWHADVVNINPCIFNFAVKVYEKIQGFNLDLSSEEYSLFKDSYEFESQNGHSHFVSGAISCHVGSINDVLKVAYATVT